MIFNVQLVETSLNYQEGEAIECWHFELEVHKDWSDIKLWQALMLEEKGKNIEVS